MSNKKVEVPTTCETSDQVDDSSSANQTCEVLSPEKKAILTRFSKAIGHLKSVKRMVEDDADVEKTLVQLSAVRAALYGVARSLILGLCENQIHEGDEGNKSESVRDVLNLMERYLR